MKCERVFHFLFVMERNDKNLKRPTCILAVSWLAGIYFASLETGFGINIFLITYSLLLIFKMEVKIVFHHRVIIRIK